MVALSGDFYETDFLSPPRALVSSLFAAGVCLFGLGHCLVGPSVLPCFGWQVIRYFTYFICQTRYLGYCRMHGRYPGLLHAP